MNYMDKWHIRFRFSKRHFSLPIGERFYYMEKEEKDEQNLNEAKLLFVKMSCYRLKKIRTVGLSLSE